jgi:hypothetical protein
LSASNEVAWIAEEAERGDLRMGGGCEQQKESNPENAAFSNQRFLPVFQFSSPLVIAHGTARTQME